MTKNIYSAGIKDMKIATWKNGEVQGSTDLPYISRSVIANPEIHTVSLDFSHPFNYVTSWAGNELIHLDRPARFYIGWSDKNGIDINIHPDKIDLLKSFLIGENILITGENMFYQATILDIDDQGRLFCELIESYDSK